MNMKYIFYLIIMSLMIMFINCSNGKNINGIYIPNIIYLSLENSREEIEYDKLIINSLNRDTVSLNRLVSLNSFDGEAAYCHGAIIVELIDRVGEDFFIHSTDCLPMSTKKLLLSYIDVGISYRNETIDIRTTKEVFPKLYYTLNRDSYISK